MKKSHFIKVAALSLCVASFVSLIACSGKSTNTAEKQKYINIGISNNITNINPINPADTASTYPILLLYPPLVDLDADMTFKPVLADSIETTDNKTFTVKINKKAEWTDGQPVTADDVIFTVRLITNEKSASMYASNFNVLQGTDDNGYIAESVTNVPGIKKIDDYTIQFVTKATVSSNIFNNGVAKNIMTVPKHIFEKIDPATLDKDPVTQKPIVTDGAYKLVDIQKDSYLKFTANTDYFRGAPKIQNLNIKIVQNSTELTVELQSGEIDMNLPDVGAIPFQDFTKLQGIKTITASAGDPINMGILFINNKTITDPKVRYAISLAINREQIVKNLMYGKGEVVSSFFTKENPYRNESAATTEYNPDKAKQLLKEAGWDSNKTITFNVPTSNQVRLKAAQVVAENLKAVGLNIKLQQYDNATVMSKLKSKDYDIATMGDTLIPIDPTYDLPFFVTTGNLGAYSNKEVDALVNKVKTDTTDAQTKADLFKMQEILATDRPILTLYATSQISGLNNRVVVGKPKDYGTFINVQDWDVK
jgi:peptide/nickel transport system substrate-binding protein